MGAKERKKRRRIGTVANHRHGQPEVAIRRKVGISAAELIERLKKAQFTEAEHIELKVAMDATNGVYAVVPTADEMSVLISPERGKLFLRKII